MDKEPKACPSEYRSQIGAFQCALRLQQQWLGAYEPDND